MENLSKLRSPRSLLAGPDKSVRCTVIGDGMVGKTCLATSFARRQFVEDYTATIYDVYCVPFCVGNDRYIINISDTAGQTDFDDVRSHVYQDTEVLLLCFSVRDRESFSSVIDSWYPEVRRLARRKCPVVLVGTQTDMRGKVPETETVTPAEAHRLAKKIGARLYVECSSKERHGLHSVFRNVLEIALRRRKRKNTMLRRFFRRSTAPF
ncbi:cell division control protein 42 homolog [Aplysia californica]|uniref:Cell division control protein 42 homolog n=1 Tax=Aplysia californica TaxID=6500 RepID=A0ABM0JWC6_APLCA|nr:cell division control protein 42 homolog [Aplysia californica]